MKKVQVNIGALFLLMSITTELLGRGMWLKWWIYVILVIVGDIELFVIKE